MSTIPKTPAKRAVKRIAIGDSRALRLPDGVSRKHGWGDELVLEEREKGVLLYAKGTGKWPWATCREMAEADEDWEDFDAARRRA